MSFHVQQNRIETTNQFNNGVDHWCENEYTIQEIRNLEMEFYKEAEDDRFDILIGLKQKIRED